MSGLESKARLALGSLESRMDPEAANNEVATVDLLPLLKWARSRLSEDSKETRMTPTEEKPDPIYPDIGSLRAHVGRCWMRAERCYEIATASQLHTLKGQLLMAISVLKAIDQDLARHDFGPLKDG